MNFKKLEDMVIQTTNSLMGGDKKTYTPKNGSPIELDAVFDNSYVEIEGIVSLKPTLRIRLQDLPAKPMKGDSVLVSEVNYRVLESREDGYGGSTLILQRG